MLSTECLLMAKTFRYFWAEKALQNVIFNGHMWGLAPYQSKHFFSLMSSMNKEIDTWYLCNDHA